MVVSANLGRVVRFFATGGCAGYIPIAPGTAGSLVGLFLYFPLQWLSPFLYLAVVVILFGVGVFLSHLAERDFGETDSQFIVIDEIVGMLLSLAFVPQGLFWALGGFVLFRIFDVLKPPPVKWFERHLPGGWGIMADDAMAAVYANLVLQGITIVIG
jgi:phosphatidylglycerophosphatase A